jgi:hypothetical protein
MALPKASPSFWKDIRSSLGAEGCIELLGFNGQSLS